MNKIVRYKRNLHEIRFYLMGEIRRGNLGAKASLWQIEDVLSRFDQSYPDSTLSFEVRSC